MNNTHITRKYEEKLAEKLEELFPKGECKERGPALVLNAEFVMALRDLADELVNEKI